jgi:hypothetical protein
MGIASFILGLLSLTGVCITLIPLLNLLNCLNLPVAVVGLILGIVEASRPASNQGGSRGLAIAGIIINGIAFLAGLVRFVISLVTTAGIV